MFFRLCQSVTQRYVTIQRVSKEAFADTFFTVAIETPSFEIPSWLNSTNITTTILLPSVTPTGVPQKCCFLVQDTVSEVWWEQTSYKTDVVTVTTYSYFETVLPNTTVTNTNSSVHTSTKIKSKLVGRNPITLVENTPLPYETAESLTGTQPITTGGFIV